MSKKKYIIILLTLTMIAGTILFNACGEKKPKLKPYNVVVIVIDTLRSDHLPVYGYEKNTAPFLLEMSKKSVVFENCFAASSWTSPATASIMTSMYPYQHGVTMGLLAIRNAQKTDPTIKINRIPESITTMAEVMKDLGYQTYGVADNLNIDERQGFTQGFDKFRTFLYKGAPEVNDTVKKWSKTLMDNGKYFLYIHYMDPHAPYHPRQPWHEPHEDSRKNRISAYDSEINFCDQHIKELYELFKWDNNTLLVVTADHGEGLWDHDLMGHGKSLYREEIQIPLIIQFPDGRIVKRISGNVTSLDILPTIRGIINSPRGETDEGMDLTPVMEGKTELPERTLYSHLWVKTDNVIEWKSAIYKNWHFLNKIDQFKLLFSLLLDPKEQDNKLDRGQQIAEQLEKSYDDFKKSARTFKQESTKIKLDKNKTDKLKSLGYVQ